LRGDSRPLSFAPEELEATLSLLAPKIAPAAVDLPGPGIALSGCGAISELHLSAYSRLGLRVNALCSRDEAKAKARALEFFPEAATFDSHAEMLQHPDVAVVDIATHPDVRGPLIEASLRAGKHVLSQKPFVLSIPTGTELIELAESRELTLAVNQNGRWAPHLASIRELLMAGAIGQLEEIDVLVAWDHSWTVGTAFDRTAHLVLFDFGIHWFDFIASLLGERELEQVSATVSFSHGQASPQPMIATVEMSGPGLRVSISFNGDEQDAPLDETRVTGADGVLVASGPNLKTQELTLTRGDESLCVPLAGDWFSAGFEGSMCELIAAAKEGREPLHSARENLRSLELAFAACASADSGVAVRPGDVEAFPGSA
jgi:predicted dehydrogenase